MGADGELFFGRGLGKVPSDGVSIATGERGRLDGKAEEVRKHKRNERKLYICIFTVTRGENICLEDVVVWRVKVFVLCAGSKGHSCAVEWFVSSSVSMLHNKAHALQVTNRQGGR